MRKKVQKITVGIIIGIICISLIGSTFYAISLPGSDNTEDTQGQEALEQEYNQRKQAIVELSAALEKSPEDVETQLALADAYYSKASITIQLNDEEYQEDLQNAITYYQKVLTQKDDNDVRLKLAISAFLSRDSDLADETYKELIEKEPQNVDVLYWYGMFQFYSKEDYKQAEQYWQTALKYNTDGEMKTKLEEMIARAQDIKP
ncbi:MAG: tetratricopeptide repeat protein [Dehalobacter sp. 4CP]|uniref:tetratricopeptide repeat protein n=1 Tax=Dehalobacter sp. CP TaxID=2594474 RepID=UPI0013C70F1D|nr:tetratricopeptide repeat protein [Dehalobacter sp.]NBJ15803.1 tetratricopeptide repeat protein [Dehalobacter sp. 4CP]